MSTRKNIIPTMWVFCLVQFWFTKTKKSEFWSFFPLKTPLTKILICRFCELFWFSFLSQKFRNGSQNIRILVRSTQSKTDEIFLMVFRRSRAFLHRFSRFKTMNPSIQVCWIRFWPPIFFFRSTWNSIFSHSKSLPIPLQILGRSRIISYIRKGQSNVRIFSGKAQWSHDIFCHSNFNEFDRLLTTK